MNAQGQFNFEEEPREDGYSRWLNERKLSTEALARQMGLPLGHLVEVWLRGDIRLRGVLRLSEQQLVLRAEHLNHLQLAVDHTPFTYEEMDSCVRLD